MSTCNVNETDAASLTNTFLWQRTNKRGSKREKEEKEKNNINLCCNLIQFSANIEQWFFFAVWTLKYCACRWCFLLWKSFTAAAREEIEFLKLTPINSNHRIHFNIKCRKDFKFYAVFSPFLFWGQRNRLLLPYIAQLACSAFPIIHFEILRTVKSFARLVVVKLPFMMLQSLKSEKP